MRNWRPVGGEGFAELAPLADRAHNKVDFATVGNRLRREAADDRLNVLFSRPAKVNYQPLVELHPTDVNAPCQIVRSSRSERCECPEKAMQLSIQCFLSLEGSHLEDEFAALHDVGVADLPIRNRPVVERDRLHVLVLL